MDSVWMKYKALWFFRRLKKKLTKRPLEYGRYAGKDIMSVQEGNDWIREAVLSGKPFLAARFGSTELYNMEHFEKPGSILRGKAMKKLCLYSGFFPEDVSLGPRFAAQMQAACTQVGLMAVWFQKMEDYMLLAHAPQAELTHLPGLEPWYSENPWTGVLRGKKVLIIHPFAETIEKQYGKRELLFPGTDILPEFELRTLKAVQTIAGEKDERFADWFEALDWMEREAVKQDFDLAIIGCGAYGLPLGARLKKRGKQVVHMGGATQILFGIKGARWERHETISKLFNEHWVRPLDTEKPKGAEKVEGACYW